MSKDQIVYNKVMAECNKLLGGMGLSWDCLADTNSVWDWIDEDMSDDMIKSVAKDCCWDRLVDGGLDNDTATSYLYGEEAV